MKNKTYNIGCIFIIILFLIGLNVNTSLGYTTSEKTNIFSIEIDNTKEDTIKLTLKIPEFEFSSIETKKGKYALIELSNEGFSTIQGEAKLPKINRMIEIPQQTNPKITINNVNWESTTLNELELPSMIVPSQPSISKNDKKIEDISIINTEYYSNNGFIKNEIAKINEIGEIRGHRFALIEISPVQYNPSSGELKLMTTCEIEIDISDSDMPKTYEINERYASPVFEKLFKVIFENHESKTTSRNQEGYLIIVYDNFYEEILPLATWKNNKGYATTTTKTSEIPGGPTTENIKEYIKDAYNNWSIPPTYVLLVGDSGQIPTFYGYDTGTAADLYYVTMNEGDYMPDIFIGRFPAADESHVDSMVNKTVQYEQGGFPSNDFINKSVFMAGNDNYQISEGTHNYVIDTYLEPNDYYCDKLYEVTYGATTSDVTNSLNDGRSLAIFSGHGSTTSWADGPQFTQSNVNALTNEDMYPFVCSHACLTGQFTVSECFGETWLRAENKAGLAFWGGSDSTYWDEDDILEKRTFSAWWDDDLEEIGAMTDMGLIYLYNYYSGGGRSRYYFECYNILGDPSVKIWRDIPLDADFTYNPEYPNPGEPIQFTDQSAGNIVSRNWDFDDGGSSSSTNPTHIYQNEGIFMVNLEIYDDQGRYDSIVKEIGVWDNWPPEAIATPEFYAGNNPVVCFDGSSSWDPDGTIVSYHWDFDDGATSDQVAPCHTFTEDGIYDVVLTVTDDGSRSADTHCEIRMDAHTPPVTEALILGSYGNNGWLKSNAKIVLDASDWTGVDYSKYKIDGGSWTTYTGAFQIWTNGYHEVSFYSVDVYGNTEDVKSVDIKIDTVKPTLNVDIAGDMVDDWYISPVTVTCSASDSGSGLNAIFYRLDGVLDDWSIYEGPFTISNEGEYVLRIYSEDMAGNTFGNNNPFSLKIDTMPPVTTYTLDGEGTDGMYYMNVTIGLSAVDTGIGLDATYYKLDGGEWTIYTDPIVVSSLGSHTFRFYSVDKLGKEETVQSVEFSINVINFDIEITNPGNGLYLFGNKFINIQRTIIIGAITVEATLMPYDPESEPDYDYVEFFIDDVSKATVTTAPFEWTWDEQAFGEHTIKVVAYHSGESVTDSMVATIFHL